MHEIEGMTENYIEETTLSTTTPGKPFPFVTGEWRNHTAEVLDIRFDKHDKYLIIHAKNGQYTDWLWIGITNSGDTDKYLAKMAKLVKTFGIYSVNEKGVACIDHTKFDSAKGKLFRFGAYGAVTDAGGQMTTDKGQPIVNYTINGPAEKLEPIEAENDNF